MREESHLDEMRDALRGDFERLAARRGEQELMRVREEPSAETTEAPEPAEELEEQPDEPEAEPAASQRRSWLGRMFST